MAQGDGLEVDELIADQPDHVLGSLSFDQYRKLLSLIGDETEFGTTSTSCWVRKICLLAHN